MGEGRNQKASKDARAAARLRPGDLVMSDFDGTVTLVDTGLAVFEALDLREAWYWEERWRDGEIDSMTCLAEQWGLIHLPHEELLELLDSLELDEDFPEFVRRARAVGAQVVVVSDGLDFYLDRMLKRLGFAICPGDPRPGEQHCLARFANHAELTDAGIKITFPHREAECDQCGNCKTAHLARLRESYERIIYLGDGYSDRCVAEHADLIFAKDSLARLLGRDDVAFLPFERFADLIEATLV